MWKKIIAGLIIGIGIIALSSYGHAQKATDNVKVEQEVDLSKYQIIRPDKWYSATWDYHYYRSLWYYRPY